MRALQQRVSTFMSQNAALEAQLLGQQNIAHCLAELPAAITTVLSRSQAPMRRMLVDPKGFGKPPVFSGREGDFYVWAKKDENFLSGVFPNVRGALAFATESHPADTTATVAVGVPLVHSAKAKARANKAKASTARAKAKACKDSKDSMDRTRARTRTRIRLNVGIVESADTTRKTVGARRTPAKVVRREYTNTRMQRMLTILTRNHQMLNQKSKSVDSTRVTLMLMLLKCEGLNGLQLEPTQVQERRHGLRVSRTGR